MHFGTLKADAAEVHTTPTQAQAQALVLKLELKLELKLVPVLVGARLVGGAERWNECTLSVADHSRHHRTLVEMGRLGVKGR